jgi:C1A family cysteine protease
MGYIPDLADFRDHNFLFAAPIPTPPHVDWTAKCPPVYDQGELGSCTANAIGAAVEFDRKKQGLKDFIPSRLFIYYNERVMEHTVYEDAGAMIRDGIKSVSKLGVPPETDWPYNVARFTQKPPVAAYKDAIIDRALSYARVTRDLTQMKQCLAMGYPFTLGFSVYDSFQSKEVAKTGIVPMPKLDENLLGGHAVLCVGYDDPSGRFIVRNSWGKGWGTNGSGYFTMPYTYLLDANLSDDFWVIKLVGK